MKDGTYHIITPASFDDNRGGEDCMGHEIMNKTYLKEDFNRNASSHILVDKAPKSGEITHIVRASNINRLPPRRFICFILLFCLWVKTEKNKPA